jgi:hypothetical protein
MADHTRARRNVADVTDAYEHFRRLSTVSLPVSQSKVLNIALRCAVKVRF